MGIGDELMMAGEARRRAAGTARRYAMADQHGQPKWHPVWEQCEHVARPGEASDGTIGYVDGRRPYCAEKTPTRWTWREYAPTPAQLVPFPPEALKLRRAAANAVVFNPTIKGGASPNKQWGSDRWRSLIRSCGDLRWVQIGEGGSPEYRGAERVVTRNFFEAVAVISGARAVVLHEGGLHHAAAALGVPAVVIYGGYISPRVTGYAAQRSLFVGSPEWPLGCGSRNLCRHCSEAMQSIRPDQVVRELRAALTRKAAA
jgi:hypothetical protein